MGRLYSRYFGRYRGIGLGRLSVLSGQKSPILVQNSAFAASSTGQAGLGAVLGTYVASKEGNIYYFPWCPAAEKIAPTDRVWFADEKAAQKAGYGPDTHCKGMGSQ